MSEGVIVDLGIRGRAALVLGSTSGLGGASASALANEGARVAFVGRRKERAVELAGEHEGSLAVVSDLTESDAAQTLVDEVTAGLGEIDILVLNSGGPPPGTAAGLTAAEVRSAVETLLVRQIEIAELVLPSMRSRGWGRIVAIGSTSIQEPLAGLALSNIARSGLAGYLKTLAREVASDGVTVNMVLPGLIGTDRIAQLDGHRAAAANVDVTDVRSRSLAAIPAGRYGFPEEFGSVVTFLCSAQASYVTGEQIRCDGGMVAGY
ncbi:SDR family oxidoreductase [Microbacterium sp. P04]|uniref:SDR family oxidoreductase n=1 Tax=Microbacterium sp. P04 TaxID=3366947 RepID=UPI0037475AA0